MRGAKKYECPDYKPKSGSRSTRCRHYKSNGQCSRPGTLYCVEWLKLNNLEEERDLLGHTNLSSKRKRSKPRNQPSTPDQRDIPVVRNITDEEIRSFRELSAEVCIASPDVGDIWIVADYTDADRQEISAQHAATLSAICGAFPGSKVTAFHKVAPSLKPPTPRPTEASP
ncbi:MAG: hypothetical protein GY854_32175 [Deltaproteobacteria bacterium]|nr:hypothetical protein [Deltaproteobacteria bacterium]